MNVKKVISPIGDIYLGSRGEVLSFLSFEIHEITSTNEVLEKAAKQLKEYFCGKRKDFDIPLEEEGTDFQIESWRALKSIPYGKTVSYKEQALMLGDIKKTRAIGTANGKNPIPIIIPCHRVIRADGALGGFSCGIEKKVYLLNLESKNF